MNKTKALLHFPSWYSEDPIYVKIFKFVFEIIAKITINWWALILIWIFEKIRLKWAVVALKQIPNGLSFFRVVTIPYVVFVQVVTIANDRHSDAIVWFWLMVAIIALDAVDGPAARDLDAISEFGKRLDPASDKFCFAFILIGYCIASLLEYNLVLFTMMMIFATWCLHIEIKLIRLAIGPFNSLFKSFKSLGKPIDDPGAFGEGKIKFNLQMIACFGGWIGLIYLPTNPSGIVFAILVLFIARSFGDKSLGRHRDEFYCLQACYIWLVWSLQTNPINFTAQEDEPPNNVIYMQEPA